MKQFTADDLLEQLRGECAAAGGQSAWAFAHDFSPQFLTDILKGRREISEKLAAALGYARRVVFEFEEIKKED